MSSHLATVAILLGLGLAPFFPARAAEPKWRVRVQVQMIALNPASGLPLLRRLVDRDQFDLALIEVDRRLESGDAELLGWPQLLTEAGGPWSSETIEEYRFSTEFEPPNIPGGSFGLKLWSLPLWGTAAPTSFETRNLGATFEVASKLAPDGRFIGMEVNAVWDRLERLIEIPGQVDQFGILGVMSQPWFRTSRVRQARLVASNGRRVLLASFLEPAPKPRLVLFLLQATAVSL